MKPSPSLQHFPSESGQFHKAVEKLHGGASTGICAASAARRIRKMTDLLLLVLVLALAVTTTTHAIPGAPATLTAGACCRGEEWHDPQPIADFGAQETSCKDMDDEELCWRREVGHIVSPGRCMLSNDGPGDVICCRTDAFCARWYARYRGTTGQCVYVNTLPPEGDGVGYCVETA